MQPVTCGSNRAAFFAAPARSLVTGGAFLLMTLSVTSAIAADLTIPSGGKVVIELVKSDAD